MIWQYSLVALSGLLGSSHCIGMCGGFALLVGMHRANPLENLRAQIVFSMGRIVSYSMLGAVAGFAGKSLASKIPQMINVPAVLCLLSGGLLVWEGLKAAGVIRRRIGNSTGAGCLFMPLFSSLLKQSALRNSLSAGIFVGFLPCGLVYAFVSLAAATGDMLQGAGTMAAFGMGTIPLMVLTGVGFGMLDVTVRQRLWRAAAWAVVVTGLITVGRGIGYCSSSAPPADRCPFCVNKTDRASSSNPFR